MSHLDCQFVFNSAQYSFQPPAVGFIVDLAENPSAAHQLIKLGISPRKDLPAVLLSDAGAKLRLIALRLQRGEAEQVVRGEVPPPRQIRLYSATWCPDCRRVKGILDGLGMTYEEIDLDSNDRAEALILERSGGRRVVPTLVLDDRIYLFNPDPVYLQELLGGPRGAAAETLEPEVATDAGSVAAQPAAGS